MNSVLFQLNIVLYSFYYEILGGLYYLLRM